MLASDLNFVVSLTKFKALEISASEAKEVGFIEPRLNPDVNKKYIDYKRYTKLGHVL